MVAYCTCEMIDSIAEQFIFKVVDRSTGSGLFTRQLSHYMGEWVGESQIFK